jgi:putative ATP-dependent endonuclease of OLD family
MAPRIVRLDINRFRGLESFRWYPEPGLNLLLGGGDVGKSTLLEAVALLLHPTYAPPPVESDYWMRRVEDGFQIEAVLSLPDEVGINQQSRPAWLWIWDGHDAVVPDPDRQAAGDELPVYKVRVRATGDFELFHEIMQPDGSTDHFGTGVRRRIGLVRLGGDDRNDRDLRLVQGSALERLVADPQLRARLASHLAGHDAKVDLSPEGKAALAGLDEKFAAAGLPHDLGLALVGGPGASLTALTGLTARTAGLDLPLSSWGSGTRRLAGLKIAAVHHAGKPLIVVDELERGLEPYRQRSLVAELVGSGSQVFATTHSPAAIAAARTGNLWYIDLAHGIGRLPPRLRAHQQADPNTFLARLAIVAEGKTEVGFVTALLERTIGGDLLRLGIWVTDGGGHDRSLELLEDLSASRLMVGGFVDDEGRSPARWQAVAAVLGPLLFRWQTGCLEQNVLSHIPEARLEELVNDPAGKETGERLRTLAERLGSTAKDFVTLSAAAPDLHQLIVEAACGAAPSALDEDTRKRFRKHCQHWFKSEVGGRELFDKVVHFGVWVDLAPQLLPLVNAVRSAVGLAPLVGLP